MLYQKIPGPFRRETEGPNRNQVIFGAWSSPELGYLCDSNWIWTEKVDGTNIRVIWDGHTVTLAGRTDNAQLHPDLVHVLHAQATEELFEQQFGENPAVLFGEGYGAGIQKGGAYRPDKAFILFDVMVGETYLRRSDVEDVATGMGLDIVPLVLIAPINQAIRLVQTGCRSHLGPDHIAEGLVGTTPDGLLDRRGHRLIVKVKSVDFYSGGSMH